MAGGKYVDIQAGDFVDGGMGGAAAVAVPRYICVQGAVTYCIVHVPGQASSQQVNGCSKHDHI